MPDLHHAAVRTKIKLKPIARQGSRMSDRYKMIAPRLSAQIQDLVKTRAGAATANHYSIASIIAFRLANVGNIRYQLQYDR